MMLVRRHSASRLLPIRHEDTEPPLSTQRRSSIPRTTHEEEASSSLAHHVCQYCHHLQDTSYGGKYRPYHEYVDNLQRSSCLYCRILFATIKVLQPSFLEPTGRFGSRDGYMVRTSGGSYGEVGISVSKNGRYSMECYFQIYRTTDMSQDQLQITTATDVAAEAGSPSMWEFIRDCLRRCRAEHDLCGRPKYPDWRPDRLMRLLKLENNEFQIQLVDHEETSSTPPYVALSHCWGGASPIRTLTCNIDQFKASICFSDLPELFRDAVKVAAELGFEYIWIDSLCIIQDNESDWARNSQVMNKVYGNAFLTIGAVSCPDSSTNFLGPTTRHNRKASQSVNVSAFDFVPHKYRVKARDFSAIRSGSSNRNYLFDRAWAWQERAFSSIYLAFLGNNVEWTCRSCHWTESSYTESFNHNELPTRIDGLRDYDPQAWYDLIMEYSDKDLTFAKDRLPALSGVAACYRPAMQPHYLAGVWADDYPFFLSWHRQQPHDVPSYLTELVPELVPRHPSWSWASIFDRPSWPRFSHIPASTFGVWELVKVDRKPVYCATLLSIDCQPATENVFGQVKEFSSITLKARACWAQMECDIHGCGSIQRPGFGPQLIVPDCLIGTHVTSQGQKTLTRVPSRDPEQHAERQRISGEVLCLFLFTIKMWKPNQTSACVLILAPHPELEGAYQRLGIGHGDLGLGSPLYSNRRDWEDYKGWEDLSEWDDWEGWFAESTEMIVKIV